MTQVNIQDRRAQRSADDSLVGQDLCKAWTGDVDTWLRDLFERALETDTTGLALVAVGGYGRREMSLHSDIDVMLLHNGKQSSRLGEVADRIWYPVWDAGLKLGHAVRTVDEALALAADDLDTATSLLDARLLAGDQDLAARLSERAGLLWHKRHRKFLSRLADRVEARHANAGEVAFRLEPDLKEGRGGLRDVQGLRWAQAAHSILWENDHGRIDAAYDLLLSVRVELHRRTGRPTDTLMLQEQDAVAHALGYGDADDMVRDLSQAARIIAWTSDDAWARIRSSLRGPLGRLRREKPIGPGLVLRDGLVHLTGDADLDGDPVLPLRAATEAATRNTQLDRASLSALAEAAPDLPEPWPPAVREAMVGLLLTGPPAIPVLEALEQVRVWERYLPEWETVRAKPQHNAYHRFTVDRHLWEAAAQAARLASQVSRPDLLVLGALFHDIGKGTPGDHTDNGVEMLGWIGPRLGFADEDARLLIDMCRHHLLLPDVATRRDLADPTTINAVAEAVGSTQLLELLAALTEADSLATGPAAWSAWKAELVTMLVKKVDEFFAQGEEHVQRLTAAERLPTPEQRALMQAGQQVVRAEADYLTVISPDRHGVFNRVAGVLTLHGLDVVDAAAVTEQGMALDVFRAKSTMGTLTTWEPVIADVEKVLAGRLALRARLADRARRYGYRTAPGAHDVEVEVRFDLDASTDSTVVEVHAPDAPGLLYRITRAFADLDLEINSAKVQTLGPTVVDSFYLQDGQHQKLTDPHTLAEIEKAVLHALQEPYG